MGKSNSDITTEFTSEQEQVFLGTMLGDGTLTPPKSNTQNSRFEGTHKAAHKEYLFWKYGVLEPSGIFPRPPYWRLSSRGHPTWRFYSRCLPILRDYRKLFYPDEIKIPPSEVLDKLEPLGLATWYQDDGGLKVGTQREPGRCWVELNTQGFTYESNLLIRDWLEKKFSFHFHLHRESDHWKLRLTRRYEAREFVDILVPYAVPCMEYKFSTSPN